MKQDLPLCSGKSPTGPCSILLIPHSSLPVPVPLCRWKCAQRGCPGSPLGDLLALSGQGQLSCCRATASLKFLLFIPAPHPSDPQTPLASPSRTPMSSQGLLAEALPCISFFLDHLGEVGGDFPHWEALLWTGFLHPSLQVALPARSQGVGAAKSWPWESCPCSRDNILLH